MKKVQIGLIGDENQEALAHRAIPLALRLASEEAGIELEHVWLPTASGACERAGEFDGLWCVPASPYNDTEAALSAIKKAREIGIPFLGSCGGFQHALIEYARNVLGFSDASHTELDSAAAMPLVSALGCSLIEQDEEVQLVPKSQLASICGATAIREQYHCNYGLNPKYRALFDHQPLRICALSPEGEVRAMELDGHPFFIITLFQSERAALRGVIPPLARAFVRAARQFKFAD